MSLMRLQTQSESLHLKIVADLTLGGYAIDVQPGPVTFEMGMQINFGVISCEYLVRYRTDFDDLTLAPRYDGAMCRFV